MFDGALDLTIVPFAPLTTMVMNTPHLYDGRIERAVGVVTARAVEVSVVAGGPWFPSDVDGEQPGGTPVTIVCDVGRLPILA
jgi:diacylglycerol kinase family enzyme